jgi:hypothetical protein
VKNLKFGVLAFGVLGLISVFLPLASFGDRSISLWDAHSGAAGMVYGTMAGFAIAAVAGVLGAVKPPFGKPQAGIALVGFIVAMTMMSDKKPWKVFDFFSGGGAIGAKLLAISAIGGLVVSIIALVKSEEA